MSIIIIVPALNVARTCSIRGTATGCILAWVVPILVGLPHAGAAEPPWRAQSSGTMARLRGISVVSATVAWASGSRGTVLRTTTGGERWVPRPVPGSSGLDFRDIHAVDAETAYVLSIGAGELSRIYKTTDGGATWTMPLKNEEPRGFLDAIAFWDADHGIVLGDPVDGRFMILTTDDAGRNWRRSAPAGMPEATAGEGAFAASGTCLVVQGDRNTWFCTGGADHARVFRSSDRGRTWTAHVTTVRAGGASAGLFSMAFRDAENGVAVGGDYQQPELFDGYVCRTSDGGRSWTRLMASHPRGYRSAVAYLPGAPGPTLVAVGPNGSDRSSDDGKSWQAVGPSGFDAVAFAAPGVGWAVGEHGRIAMFTHDAAGGR